MVSLHLCRGRPWGRMCSVRGIGIKIVSHRYKRNLQDVPYYCPSCDVNVRRANKAKKQAQAKEMKAKAQLAESRKVEVLSKTISKQVTEDSVTEYDNSTSDDELLLVLVRYRTCKTVEDKF